MKQKEKEFKDLSAATSEETNRLKALVSKNEQKAAELETSMADIKAQLAQSKDTHKLAKDEYVALQKTMSSKDTELASSMKTKADLEASKAQLDETVKTLKDQKTALEKELRDALSAKLASENELRVASSNLDQLYLDQLSAKDVALAAKEKEIKSLLALKQKEFQEQAVAASKESRRLSDLLSKNEQKTTSKND